MIVNSQINIIHNDIFNNNNDLQNNKILFFDANKQKQFNQSAYTDLSTNTPCSYYNELNENQQLIHLFPQNDQQILMKSDQCEQQEEQYSQATNYSSNQSDDSQEIYLCESQQCDSLSLNDKNREQNKLIDQQQFQNQKNQQQQLNQKYLNYDMINNNQKIRINNNNNITADDNQKRDNIFYDSNREQKIISQNRLFNDNGKCIKFSDISILNNNNNNQIHKINKEYQMPQIQQNKTKVQQICAKNHNNNNNNNLNQNNNQNNKNHQVENKQMNIEEQNIQKQEKQKTTQNQLQDIKSEQQETKNFCNTIHVQIMRIFAQKSQYFKEIFQKEYAKKNSISLNILIKEYLQIINEIENKEDKIKFKQEMSTQILHHLMIYMMEQNNLKTIKIISKYLPAYMFIINYPQQYNSIKQVLKLSQEKTLKSTIQDHMENKSNNNNNVNNYNNNNNANNNFQQQPYNDNQSDQTDDSTTIIQLQQ